MKYLRRALIIITSIAVLYLSIYGAGSTTKKEYSIAERLDGGYSLKIVLYKRYWKLITAEGVFPRVRRICTIELTGIGRDWSYRSQNGFYYSSDEIKSINREWDFGYAWISKNKKYLYLNLFWVKSPDRVSPADVNGKYQLEEYGGKKMN